MSSITAVAANPHSSQSGDKELNCGKSACDCLTEGITLHESTWLAGRHPQSLYWYNSLSSWTAARLNHATSPTEGIKTAVLIFKCSNCVRRNVVFIGEIASIDVSPLLFTGVSSLSVEAVLFCVRWINVIQASFIPTFHVFLKAALLQTLVTTHLTGNILRTLTFLEFLSKLWTNILPVMLIEFSFQVIWSLVMFSKH